MRQACFADTLAKKKPLPVIAFSLLSEFLYISQSIQQPAQLSVAKSLNSLIILHNSIKCMLVSVSWTRLLTVFWIGLFFSCAVLEADLGDRGDDFGDVYDTYVHSQPIQSPSPTAIDYRQILPVYPASTSSQLKIVWLIDGLLVRSLPFLAFFIHRHLKRRQFQVLHAVWRL